MIVDDSANHREDLRMLVKSLGGRVTVEASSGREALDLYPIYGADIVMMDMAMPEMDGIQTTEEIMRLDRNAKVIMFSPIVSAALIKRALTVGAKEYIRRPIAEEEAVRLIRAVLQ